MEILLIWKKIWKKNAKFSKKGFTNSKLCDIINNVKFRRLFYLLKGLHIMEIGVTFLLCIIYLAVLFEEKTRIGAKFVEWCLKNLCDIDANELED